MQMNIKLNLETTEQELFKTLIQSNCLEMSTSQLYNFCVYMDVVKKSKGVKKWIVNQNNILQACNYHNDDNYEYWFALDNNLNFTDVAIPLNLNIDNEKSFENIPEIELNIIKSIRKCENISEID